MNEIQQYLQNCEKIFPLLKERSKQHCPHGKLTGNLMVKKERVQILSYAWLVDGNTSSEQFNRDRHHHAYRHYVGYKPGYCTLWFNDRMYSKNISTGVIFAALHMTNIRMKSTDIKELLFNISLQEDLEEIKYSKELYEIFGTSKYDGYIFFHHKNEGFLNKCIEL